ncbi:hypothetical protein DIPPA_35266 [Diplonema papillatum]|nr:hypothetical protein DIPPA_35266 [Diplonema papillatum]|eukprot:gene2188-3363_t
MLGPRGVLLLLALVCASDADVVLVFITDSTAGSGSTDTFTFFAESFAGERCGPAIVKGVIDGEGARLTKVCPFTVADVDFLSIETSGTDAWNVMTIQVEDAAGTLQRWWCRECNSFEATIDGSGPITFTSQVTSTPGPAAPPTAAPATAPPATGVPETVRPATKAPATAAPATQSPATDPPATAAPPPTAAPDTGAPATDPPATSAPQTSAPAAATSAPQTTPPPSDSPATLPPATDAPLTGAPATDGPDVLPPEATVTVSAVVAAVGASIDDKVERKAVEVSSNVAAVASVLAVNPTTAIGAGRLSIIVGPCTADPDVRLPQTVSVTQLEFSGPNGQHLGCVVGNGGLLLGVTVVHVVASRLLAMNVGAKGGSTPLVAAQALLRFPAMTIFVLMFLFQGLTSCGASLLLYGADSSQQMIGAAAVLVTLSYPIINLRLSYHVPQNCTCLDDYTTPGWLAFIIGRAEWVDVRLGLFFVNRFGSAFINYTFNSAYFATLDLALSFCIGFVDGIRAATLQQCGHKRMAMFVLFFVFFVLIAWSQPYRRVRDNLSEAGVAVLTCTGLITLAVSYYQNTEEPWTIDFASRCFAVAGGLLLLKSILDLLTLLYVVCTGRRRKLEVEYLHSAVELYEDVPTKELTGERSTEYEALAVVETRTVLSGGRLSLSSAESAFEPHRRPSDPGRGFRPEHAAVDQPFSASPRNSERRKSISHTIGYPPPRSPGSRTSGSPILFTPPGFPLPTSPNPFASPFNAPRRSSLSLSLPPPSPPASRPPRRSDSFVSVPNLVPPRVPQIISPRNTVPSQTPVTF